MADETRHEQVLRLQAERKAALEKLQKLDDAQREEADRK